MSDPAAAPAHPDIAVQPPAQTRPQPGTGPRHRSIGRRIASGVVAHSFFRYGLVGGLSAALDTGLLWLLHGVAHMWLPAATLLAVASAFAFNFALNRLWSFGSVAAVGPQLFRYFVQAAGNWMFTVLSVSGLASLGMNYLVAKILVLVVAALLNYVGYRIWVFR